MKDCVYLALEVQVEILRRLPVKSLLQFRSVSKPWKSLIDSPNFVAGYRGQLHHLLVSYAPNSGYRETEYVSIVDDDAFPEHKLSHIIPSLLLDRLHNDIIGCSDGLLCISSYFGGSQALLWNISIRKGVSVVVPNLGSGIYETVLGFGVCQDTADPKIVKINQIKRTTDMESVSCIPWQVEVFTLSTGAWRSPYSSNLPCKSVQFGVYQEVVDGILYWLATDRITTDDGVRCYHLIISFDLTSEEFSEVNLPDSIAYLGVPKFSMFKRRESLIMLEHANNPVSFVWMMENGVQKSFTKLFVVNVNESVIAFRENGEAVVESHADDHNRNPRQVLVLVYDPYSKQMVDLGIHGISYVLSAHPYMETLLLLDQPDLIV